MVKDQGRTASHQASARPGAGGAASEPLRMAVTPGIVFLRRGEPI